MARLSKTSPFQIHNDDEDDRTPDSLARATSENVVEEEEDLTRPFLWPANRRDDGFVTESDDEKKDVQYDGAQEGDDEKNYTRTSISSMPESNYPTDHERTPAYKPYTPTYSRPSVRRLQMSSPLRKGKVGTPHSEPRGSPRARRKGADYDDERESKPLPLVLLHITALPLNVPWSPQLMRETLPQHIFDNMQLLKSKLSDTVLKRGILIPHPGDDYELLEEKLLEALELQEPRISKCGHFRARDSTSSTITTGSDSADSGMGSSVDGLDEDHCTTCHHHLRAAGTGKQKWSIKVFAANGLMRASAWSAAWSEMERVDVEIMPWMKDDLRIRLDEKEADKFALQRIDHEADERRVNALVEERLRVLEHDAERAREAEMAREIEQIVMNEQRQHSNAAHDFAMAYIEPAEAAEDTSPMDSASTELPDIYRRKDIPLSILLRNYIFLLIRKRWNTFLLILVASIGGLLSLLGPVAITGEGGLWTLDSPITAWTKSIQDAVAVPKLGLPEPQVSVVSQSSVDDEVSSGNQNVVDDLSTLQDRETMIGTESAVVPDDEEINVDNANVVDDVLNFEDSENVFVNDSPVVADDDVEDETQLQRHDEDAKAPQWPAGTDHLAFFEDFEPVCTMAAEPEMLDIEGQGKCLRIPVLSESKLQCMVDEEVVTTMGDMY